MNFALKSFVQVTRTRTSSVLLSVACASFVALAAAAEPYSVTNSASSAPLVVGQISANDPLVVGASLSVSASYIGAPGDNHYAAWTFGDGTPAQPGTVWEANGSGTALATHVFAAAGAYPITVTITDETGLSSQVSRNVVVYDPRIDSSGE